ncbi:BrnT family toxin [uncultured Hyphomonas sp.]|uniref:BrnT family toxin n=1 Tax=uncultured Hyphomonas sp. TaxID=225298 RepID=UPI002AAA6545|nr:BrnT family toxin [uncultured Hyphomonas sp.]
MNNGRFSWDDDKAAKNLANHGVSFESGLEVLTGQGPIYQRREDDMDYGERRLKVLGMDYAGRLLCVIMVERGEIEHIISVWKATNQERRTFNEYAF